MLKKGDYDSVKIISFSKFQNDVYDTNYDSFFQFVCILSYIISVDAQV